MPLMRSKTKPINETFDFRLPSVTHERLRLGSLVFAPDKVRFGFVTVERKQLIMVAIKIPFVLGKPCNVDNYICGQVRTV